VTVDGAGNPLVEEGKDPNVEPGSLAVIAARSGRFDGRAMRAGHGYVLASGLSGPAAADQNGNIVVADFDITQQRLTVLATRTGQFYGRAMRAGHVYVFSRAVHRCRADGCPVGRAALGEITGVTVDQDGNWVLADTADHVVRVIAARSGTFYGLRMRALHAYTVAGTGGAVSDSGDGGPPARAELGWYDPSDPYGYELPFEFFGLASDPRSGLYLSDGPDRQVRMIPDRSGVFFGQRMRAGNLYTVAGTGASGDPASGALADRAAIGLPYGLTVDAAGNLLFADGQNGKIWVLAARAGTYYGQPMTGGHLYAIAGGGTQPPATGVAALAAELVPEDVTVDSQGNVLFTDHSDGSRVWVLPTRSGTYYGQPMSAGDLYLLAGGGSSIASGVPATSADLGNCRGLVLDGHGNLVLGASGPNTVRVLATRGGTFYGQQMTAGDIYTIAGGLQTPVGLAVDSHGNVIVTVSGIRKFVDVVAAVSGTFYGVPMTAGHVYAVAGGGRSLIPLNQRGTRVMLRNPEGVAVSPSGDILVAELEAGRVLLIRG
jgi:hypothetical protein